MICQRCGEEVRFGWRHGLPGWWHREDVDHEADPVVPEARTYDLDEDGEPIIIVPPPEPEVACHDVSIDDFPPRSGIRQICNLVKKTPGWELRRLTASRGAYLGAKGQVLSTSDSVVLGARGPARLDGSVPIAVASWRDGAFDFAHIGAITDSHQVPMTKVSSTDMKGWIKGDLPDAVPES
jgi:hypothetical protein